ncbi:glycoside hydrolase family 3 C-terminal domain-containing protein [Arachidicoccus terrestris]|uniref:glycoside hydrolase family 3 C-terminal domain-containing protein n=1 Tax=Arachidicoccus terrestris TaxID=2875539 RepID=UPI001CC5E083|nr:glycoside hydrolase family 3 C-terminal domain-containing protein [Arachidicoccus terrestris]UAY57046.1 glycoside hydrolase family 3 C-terminal domain-containing protein [Arachidicoccus terrestris]
MKRISIKLGILTVAIILAGAASGQDFKDPSKSVDVRVNDFISQLTLKEKVDQLMNNTPAIQRLGVPAYNWWNEALHGLGRSGVATIFPQAIGEAATFDPELLKQISTAIGKEARAQFNINRKNGYEIQYGGLSFWTPNINIFRDPRWGRGQETYGEDPYLTSQMGVAFVEGLQGNDPAHLMAAACAKHYAIHSGPEKLRHEFDAKVSLQDMQETYFPAFHALTKAGVESFMSAYNRVNGEACSASDFLIDTVLRGWWGFKGHIVSDCDAVQDLYTGHHLVKTPAEAAALAINKGLDLNCGTTYYALVDAIKQGLTTEAKVDSALAAVTRTRIKLGLLDPAGSNPYDKISPDELNSEAHRKLAHKAAVESVVMLKNSDHTLPLANNLQKYYITGPNATNMEALIGNYYGVNNQMSTILEGIAGHIAKGSQLQYRKGILMDRPNDNPIDWTTGDAQQAEAIFVVLGIDGTLEGEEGEAIASKHFGDRLDYNIPANQVAFLEKLRKGYKGKIVTIVTGGSPMNLKEVHELSDAVLMVWYPGEEGGNAVADIIFGNQSPSGKLPVTFPMSLDDLPDYKNYDMTGRTYRYMEKAPMYPFGFGLSYGQFVYEDLKADRKVLNKGQQKINLTVNVKNEAKTASDEVVQLYVAVPDQSFETPNYSLKAFKRIEVGGGANQQVSFTLTADDLKVYNEEGKSVLPKGTYKIYVGGSSPIARSQELGAPALRTLTIEVK